MLMDYEHTMVTIRSAEIAVDGMAKSLKNSTDKSAEDFHVLGLLHKASSHLYCAHSVLIEAKDKG